MSLTAIRLVPLVFLVSAIISPSLSLAAKSNRETECSDRIDNDGDGHVDCADADCFGQTVCLPDGSEENTDSKCSDWVDNDNDGFVDCDDMDCQDSRIDACKGSWDKDPPKTNDSKSVGPVPELAATDDTYGKNVDIDVSAAPGLGGFRFSVVGGVVPIQFDFEKKQWDTYFSRLQLRVFGTIPYIQNSFFLISARVEKAPKISFALFQIPLWKTHYVNLNTGGGSLSNVLILSTAKQLLLDPAYKLYAPFETDSSVTLEMGGPLVADWRYTYRAFASGGTGRFSNYIGGMRTDAPNENYTFSVGAQAGINFLGIYSRWDSPFLYEKAPLALALALGVKFERRNTEQFPAADLQLVFRYKHFIALFENYWKREISFGSWQTMYNLQVGFLIWPRHFLLAAEAGQFLATPYENRPANPSGDLIKIRNYWQARAALHWYFWRNIGIASLAFVHGEESPSRFVPESLRIENSLRIEVQYRF